VPLLSHHCGFVIAVVVSPSSSHCHGVHHHFIIAVVMLPLSLHRHSVVVTVLLSLSQCCHCGFIVTVASSLPHGVIIAVMSLHCHCRCHGHGHIVVMVIMVVVVVALWSSLLLLH